MTIIRNFHSMYKLWRPELMGFDEAYMTFSKNNSIVIIKKNNEVLMRAAKYNTIDSKLLLNENGKNSYRNIINDTNTTLVLHDPEKSITYTWIHLRGIRDLYRIVKCFCNI